MKKIILIVVLAIVALQLIPVEKSNPPVTAELEADPAVMAVLERSCYDCHSNETVWPWYSKIAPIKWSISSHVKVGRLQLNFSEWGDYELGKQRHLAEEIWQEVGDNGMPLKSYLNAHKDAALSPADKKVLETWSKSFENEQNEEKGEHKAGEDADDDND